MVASGLWTVDWEKGEQQVLQLCAGCGMADMAHSRKSRFSERIDNWYTYDRVVRVELIVSFTRPADEAKALEGSDKRYIVVETRDSKRGKVKSYVYL